MFMDIREAIRAAAAQVRETREKLRADEAVRDALIQQAKKSGVEPGVLRADAGVSKARLYQILGEEDQEPVRSQP
jgi:hypothetical protein